MVTDWKERELKYLQEMGVSLINANAPEARIEEVKTLIKKLREYKGERLGWGRVVNKIIGKR